jgi:hypothetical protein
MVTHERYRQDGDGIPHFAYFDKPTQLSFVWDGSAEHPIQVAWGGYGEPIIDHLETHLVGLVPETPAAWLHWFKIQCEEYVESEPKVPPIEAALRRALGEEP